MKAPTTEWGTAIGSSMCGHEPPGGHDLPPGRFDDGIERAFGAERRHRGECGHRIESDELDRRVCGPKSADAAAKPEGTRRRPPRCISAAVEGAVTDECDRCPEFEG